MMGRGALNTPNLSKVVKYNVPKMAWNEVLQLLFKYVQMENQFDTGFTTLLASNNGYVIWIKNILKR